MGSICHINRNPKTWKMYYPDKKLKEKYGGDTLVHIAYGSFDDYPQMFDLEMLMRESIYNKLVSGEYLVSEDSSWKRKLIVTDKEGKIIEPIDSEFCY